MAVTVNNNDIARVVSADPSGIKVEASDGTLHELKAGDLIFSGTPEGVGEAKRGQTLVGAIAGVGEIEAKLV